MLDMQTIGGFLAVLSITGGSFSPKAKKLPFSVTSVDGDNYLLYYSSIDLAGHSPSGKPGNVKMKRSLSLNDSPSEHNRLRIPMKGRIQLVYILSLMCSCLRWSLSYSFHVKLLVSHINNPSLQIYLSTANPK